MVMLTDQVIRQLSKQWERPAVRVNVKGRSYEIGEGGDDLLEVRVHRPRVLARIARSPSLGFGEGYMAGDIEVNGSLMNLLHGAYVNFPDSAGGRVRSVVERMLASPITARGRAVANAKHHYDLGNDFYRLWLDQSLTYSCAYFLRDQDELERAQRQKLELLCRKARVEPGQHLLDIGCGWGSLLFHAARHHGMRVTGVTPAGEQADYIEREAKRLSLDDRVHVHRGDWRDLRGQFDRIISIGMFEHVGREHYPSFFRRWHDLLTPGGLSVLQTIGRMAPQRPDPWIRRYIFPGGYLPTLTQITSNSADTSLWVSDVENLRWHYARTLACWAANFDKARDRIAAERDECFVRMWWLYLQASEAAFRWGGLHLWQVVLAKDESAPCPLNREVGLAETFERAAA